MRPFLILCYSLLMLAVPNNVQAQQNPVVKTISRNGSTIEVRTSLQQDGQPVKQFIIEAPQQQRSGVSEERRVLVKLKGQPLAKKLSRNGSGSIRLINEEHARFLKDLQQLHSLKKASGIQPKILAEFRNVFNGYALIISSEVEDEIRKLPYVASVLEDRKVEAIDESSNQVIKADQVWATLDITGRGVVIGIIDTGIDYNHTDLGGGIGNSFKVVGGYDFVNNDEDPMDDHGHGTHVAGIAAANGSIKGVAPDAKLMAFKVLDAGGYGWDSWIIAGIERSADPDQNPATNDAVDVVNMSLGRAPMPEDPFTEAIANATALGVTFVVAAGNSGNYFTVGSPGVAPDAITVGATELSDVTAYFSSKGPTEFDNLIKPDVSAPGVAIHSTFLQNQFVQLNGTSMASPHVAGAAALLLEKNPSWTPEMIKGALMNNAKPATGADAYWNQGAGRIDILKSIQSPFMVTPGSISLGKYNPLQPEQKTFKATLYNTSREAREFLISATGDIVNAHVAVEIQPSSTTLAPGESKEIMVTFNTSLGLPDKNFTDGYYGALLISSAGETVSIPVAMVHAKLTRMIFSTPLPNIVHIVGINGSDYYKGFTPTSPQVEVSLPNADIEVIATYGNKSNIQVVKDLINGGAGEDILLTRDLAKNRIVFAFKDIHDQPIALNPYHVGGTLFSTQRLLSVYFFPVDTFYVSDNSVAQFDMSTRDTFDNIFYDLTAGVPPGQYQDITIIKKADHSIDIRSAGATSYEWQYVSDGFHFGRGGLNIRNTIPFSSAQIRVYTAERKETDNFSFSKVVLKDQNEQVSETGFFSFYENDLIRFTDQFFLRNKSAQYKTDHFTYELGNTLLRWNGRMTNQANEILLYDVPFVGLFNYALNERIQHELDYELKADGQVINSGKLLNRVSSPSEGYDPIWKQTVTPGQYSLTVKSTKHQVHGVDGFGQIDLEFDTRKEMRNPPVLSLFSLMQEGLTTNTIVSGESASFMIGLSNCTSSDYCNSETTPIVAKLFIKSDGADWQELELINLKGDTLVADINETLPEGYYSTKVVATDRAGNSFTYTLSPAFFVSPASVPPVTRINLLEPLNHANNIVRTPQFKWENIDAVSYTFELSKSSTFSVVESTLTLADTELFFPATLDYNTIYYWRVKPNYENSSGAWSDVFDFRSIEHRTNLIFPENQSLQGVFNFITFEWEATEGSNYYHIQVSRDPYFTSIEFENGISGTSVFSGLIPEDGVTYYWRVRAYLNTGIWISWSEVFSYTGDRIPQKVQLVEPVNELVIETRKPFLIWTSAYQAKSYTIQLSRDATFTDIEKEEIVELYYHALTDALGFKGTYYWRVQANYENESGPWSDAFNFTIEEPNILLEQPANNSAQSNAQYVTFGWQSVAFAFKYHFQLSKDPQFSSIEYETETFNPTATWLGFPQAEVVYYWRVRAYSYHEYFGDWSQTFSFTGQDDAYVTTLLIPVNNSINTSLQPVFHWTQTPLAQWYTFQISRTQDFSSIDLEYETLGDFDPLPNELDFSTRYYWRVRAHYENEIRPWSDVFNFRTEDLMLTLKSPVDQSIQTSSIVEFEWNVLNNVAHYHFQLSKEESFNSIAHETELAGLMYEVTSGLESSSTYYWRVRPYYNLNYYGEWSIPFSFTTDVITSLSEQIRDSKRAIAYPNPFTTSATIEFYVARAGDVSLEILNPQGQVIDHFTKFFPLGGRQSFQWKLNDVVSGVYVCKITSADKTEVIKLIRNK